MPFVDIFRLTRREYYLDFFVTPPLTVILAAHSIWVGSFGVWWIAQFVVGFELWTLYEYLLHRIVLHRLPFGREIHALHHRNQIDYIAQPPWLTIGLYLLSWLIFGFRASALMVGFSTGYCLYAALHTLFHYRRHEPGSLLWRLDQRHARHHRDGEVCFGVTDDWWDRLFGTEGEDEDS